MQGEIKRAGSGRKFLKQAVKLIVLLGVLYFVGRELARNIAGVNWSSVKFHPGYVAGAMLCMLVSTTLSTAAFRALLSKVLTPPRWPVLLGIAWLPRLGKYIPGKLAAIGGAIFLLRQHGIAVVPATGAMLLENALSVIVGLQVAAPLLLVEPLRSRIPYASAGCVLVVIVGLVCIHPKVFFPSLNVMLRRFGRPTVQTFPRMRDYVGPVCLHVLMWFFLGLSLWLLLQSLVPSMPANTLLACVSASSLATTLGFVALFSPGGLGVREGILLLVLGTFVDAGVASVVVVLSRLAQTALEIMLTAVGAVLLQCNPPTCKCEDSPTNLVSVNLPSQPGQEST